MLVSINRNTFRAQFKEKIQKNVGEPLEQYSSAKSVPWNVKEQCLQDLTVLGLSKGEDEKDPLELLSSMDKYGEICGGESPIQFTKAILK